MSTYFKRVENDSINVRKEILWHIFSILESMGKDINMFHLLDNDISFDEDQFQSREINDELAIIISKEDLLALTILNDEQQHAYDLIL